MTEQLAPLWHHQKEAIARAGERFALFFDPGTGKTRTAIEIYKLQKTCTGNTKAIIFAPLNVCRNWEVELKKYLGGPFTHYLVAGQTKAAKLRVLSLFSEEKTKEPQFLVCNIESLRGDEYVEAMIAARPQFIIVDESHNFKSHSSQQTKGLLELVRKSKPANLYLLTGTPAPQGDIDLWSTFYLLGKTTDTFFVWRKKYFEDKNERRRGTRNYWPDYQVTAKSQAIFQQWLSECSAVAKKDEVLDLPPYLRTTLYAEMSAEQKRHYETMEEYLFAIDAEGNELNASNVLVRTLRLQQILAGFIGEMPIKENPRLDAIEAAIEKTNGEQFIIWTIFKGTYRDIARKLDDLGITFAKLTGEESATERFDNMNAFQNGDIRCLIAHPKAGGVGVNLTAASYSIHYTRSFSLTDDLQAEARNYRGGSERHSRITRIDIVTPNTIDEDITEALYQKKSAQEFIMGLRRKHVGQ